MIQINIYFLISLLCRALLTMISFCCLIIVALKSVLIILFLSERTRIPWHDFFNVTDINVLDVIFNSHILGIFNNHFRLKRVHHRSDRPNWLNSCIHRAIKPANERDCQDFWRNRCMDSRNNYNVWGIDWPCWFVRARGIFGMENFLNNISTREMWKSIREMGLKKKCIHCTLSPDDTYFHVHDSIR